MQGTIQQPAPEYHNLKITRGKMTESGKITKIEAPLKGADGAEKLRSYYHTYVNITNVPYDQYVIMTNVPL